MTQKLLLVDFENVQQIDLGRLDESYQIIIFVGASEIDRIIDILFANKLISETNGVITYKF